MTHFITTVAVIAGAERRIGAIAAVVAQLGFRSCGEHWICAFKPRTRAREQKLIVLLLLMLLHRPSSFAPDQRGRWNDGVAIKYVYMLYVYMYICIYVYMYICIYVYMYI